MHLHILTILAVFASGALSAGWLGINCRGSLLCHGSKGNRAARELAQILDTMDGSMWAEEHEQIACYASRCAFFQFTDGYGGSIADAQRLAWDIVNHGCQSCGSCPILYPHSNRIKQGELTINYVKKPCQESGVCPSFMYDDGDGYGEDSDVLPYDTHSDSPPEQLEAPLDPRDISVELGARSLS